MNRSQARHMLNTLADQLLEEGGGVSVMRLVKAFKAATEGDLVDLSAELIDEAIRNWAQAIVDNKRRAGNSQLSFDDIGEFDETVTTNNGEGEQLVKLLKDASQADLEADLQYHEDNATAAIKARTRARLRNRRLLPIMQEHNCSAGEALRILGAVI